jgi:hypothetical protein
MHARKAVTMGRGGHPIQPTIEAVYKIVYIKMKLACTLAILASASAFAPVANKPAFA